MSGSPIVQVRHETERWAELKAAINADDLDAQTVMDTLEGETELLESLLALATRVVEIENEMLPGLDAYLAALASRRARLKQSATTLRTIVLTSMERAGISEPIKGSLFTLAMNRRAPGLVITDEAEIPSEFFVDADPKLDRKRLKDALKEHTLVPGASLDNGSTSLTIRIA